MNALRPAALRRLAPFLLLGLLGHSLPAHEFWLRPVRHLVEPGDAVELTLRVGMNFQGEPRPFSRELVTGLRHFSAAGVTDEFPRVPATAPATDALSLPIATPGTHLFAVDTIAKPITLVAEKFNAYLEEDGLDHILELRAKTGQSQAPGRERYARCVKALVRAGAGSDATWAVRTSQRLEIVPQSDPFALTPGAMLGFTVYFDSRPLGRALVRAWHRQDDRLTELQDRTNADGQVAFRLPCTGEWMISVVHMVPATDEPECDWRSFWGNLTFAVPAP